MVLVYNGVANVYLMLICYLMLMLICYLCLFDASYRGAVCQESYKIR